MADFEPAFQHIIEVEGGYVDDPDDAGGRTRYGISERAHPAPWDDDELTLDEAREIYREKYWDRLQLSVVQDQEIAVRVFDIAVNVGRYRGTKIVQMACRRLGASLELDGKIGPNTLGAVNDADPAALDGWLRVEQGRWYLSIVGQRPDQRKFLLGWMRRALQ